MSVYVLFALLYVSVFSRASYYVFESIFVDFCCVYHCVDCSYSVQYTLSSGNTLLGNHDGKEVGPHVYIDKGMCVTVYVYLCVLLCI